MQPSDEFGSPTLDEIAIFSQQFANEYQAAMGEAAEDIGVEVSSPVSCAVALGCHVLHCLENRLCASATIVVAVLAYV